MDDVKDFTPSPALEAEIQHRINSAQESDSDLSRAEALQHIFQDSDEPGTVAYTLRAELQNVGIVLGIYVPYTAQELAEVQVTHGPKYDFKRGQLFYCFAGWGRLFTANF